MADFKAESPADFISEWPADMPRIPQQGARPLDDGEREMGLLLGPCDQLSSVAAVGEHGLDKGPEAAGRPQQRLGAVTVLHVTAMNLHGEQAAISVGQDVPLAARALLARVVAARPPFWSPVRTDWLSMIAAVGLASRPARARSAIRTA